MNPQSLFEAIDEKASEMGKISLDIGLLASKICLEAIEDFYKKKSHLLESYELKDLESLVKIAWHVGAVCKTVIPELNDVMGEKILEELRKKNEKENHLPRA